VSDAVWVGVVDPVVGVFEFPEGVVGLLLHATNTTAKPSTAIATRIVFKAPTLGTMIPPWLGKPEPLARSKRIGLRKPKNERRALTPAGPLLTSPALVNSPKATLHTYPPARKELRTRRARAQSLV
jgi:hypothetical protein